MHPGNLGRHRFLTVAFFPHEHNEALSLVERGMGRHNLCLHLA
jgi:hypothetical protein